MGVFKQKVIHHYIDKHGNECKKLILNGFANSIIDNIMNNKIKNKIKNKIDNWLLNVN